MKWKDSKKKFEGKEEIEKGETEMQPFNVPDHYSYVKEFSNQDIEWLEQLPYSITMPSLGAIGTDMV